MTVNLPAFTSNPPQIHHQKTTFCTPFLPKPPQKRVNQPREKITAKAMVPVLAPPDSLGALAVGGGGDGGGGGGGYADELGEGVVGEVGEPDVAGGVDGEAAGVADAGSLVAGGGGDGYAS